MKAFITLFAGLLQVLPIMGTEEDSLAVRRKSFYVGSHFAGNTGLLSINGGKKFFNDRLVIGAGYGYLPEKINGAEVHSIFLKTSYNFSKGMIYKKAQWYAGFTSLYAITKNTFVSLPSWYPEKYYAPNAIHFSPYIGLRVPLSFYKPRWAENVSFHIELGALDTYLWYHIINSHVDFWDICNLSYGLYYDFKIPGKKFTRIKMQEEKGG